MSLGMRLASMSLLSIRPRTRVSFVPLDYESVNFASGMRLQYTDFGDDVLNLGSQHEERDINDDGLRKLLCGNMWEFLNAEL